MSGPDIIDVSSYSLNNSPTIFADDEWEVLRLIFSHKLQKGFKRQQQFLLQRRMLGSN
ncbi:hypothetical protein E4U26_002084 [Claviceps purpurea]|nr:hypothetical protein E4U26_002084 [Claviceps purpurea]